jgi:DNA end-binding protein Ku
MSARPTWKGVLKISLVTIPIKVFPATESSESLSFNQLHDHCQTRVQQRKWCPNCAREISSAEIVKGFEFEKGRYVILQEAELDAVRPESTRVIDLVQFADASDLDPMFIDRTYYVVPENPDAAEAFVVMRAAMAGLMGVGKLAIYGREYVVAVKPQREVFVLHTLHRADGILNASAAIDGLLPPDALRATADQRRLAGQVIAAFRGPLSLGDFTDEYQADLRRLIDAKIAGEEIVAVAPVDTPAVVNLRDALVASLAKVSIETKPAKVKPVKRMRAS